MDIICIACGKKHKSNAKLEENLSRLAPGKKLQLKCSQCAEPIIIGAEMLSEGPGLETSRKTIKTVVKPPEPPDTAWLEDGVFEEEAIVSDIPQAIVLVPDEKMREQIVSALTGLGYRAETADSVDDAMEKMQFFNYSSIVMHSSFDGGGLLKNQFHSYMCSMNMSRRRYIFYVLVGEELKTFYNLQALAYSANLVVNDSDAGHFGVILRKSIPEYEELFGPFMEELKVQGR